jgi:hypothetical protein
METNVGNPVTSCPHKKAEEVAEEQKVTKHQIEFKIEDENGNPLPDVTMQIALPDESIVEKTSDENGKIKINNIEPGECTILSDWKDYNVNEVVLIQ